MLASHGAGQVGIATAKALGATPNRNRMKRRMREIVRRSPQAWRKDLDYVILMKATSATTDFLGLFDETVQLVGTLNKRWEEGSESS
jgi:ribonuclease P protein component